MPNFLYNLYERGEGVSDPTPLRLIDNQDGSYSISNGLCVETVNVTTTGTSGSATGSATTLNSLRGLLVAVNIDYNADAPATTDVTLTDVPSGTAIAVFSDSKTDVVHLPLKQNVDAAGAAITGVYSNYPLTGKVSVSVAGSDALTNCVVVRLIYLAV